MSNAMMPAYDVAQDTSDCTHAVLRFCELRIGKAVFWRPPSATQYFVMAPPCCSTACTRLAMLGMRDFADG